MSSCPSMQVAIPDCSDSLRDIGLVLVGILFAVALNHLRHFLQKAFHEYRLEDDEHAIRTISELRKSFPPGAAGSTLENAPSVVDHLDKHMLNFVAKSPMIYLATVVAQTGMPFISPKGGQEGFVKVITTGNEEDNTIRHTLAIPDRPGNRQMFGLQNILGDVAFTTHKANILFELPGTTFTLRCGGTARLSQDPALLKEHEARRAPPELVILIEVEHVFFHCAKAYMWSKVWDPSTWKAGPSTASFAKYFSRKSKESKSSIVEAEPKPIWKSFRGPERKNRSRTPGLIEEPTEPLPIWKSFQPMKEPSKFEKEQVIG